MSLWGSLSIFFSPFFGCGLKFGAIAFVKLSNLGNEGIIGVGIGKQRGDREKHLRNGEGGWPLILEDVKTNRSVSIDVRVIDLSDEVAFWWAEGIVCWEMNVEEEDSSRIGTIIRTDDSGLPVKLVILSRACWAVGWRILLEIKKFLLYSLLSHLVIINTVILVNIYSNKPIT